MVLMNNIWPDQEMQCVILAGGKGTRMEYSSSIPKPMVDVAGKPLLQHIIETYMKFGVRSFIIPVGYKKEIIFGYFMGQNPISVSKWDEGAMRFEYYTHTVRVVDTGEETMTGGRLKRLEPYLHSGGPFHFTYGDGLSNVNLQGLVSVHQRTGATATLTVVHPEGRFGRAVLDTDGKIIEFGEKVEAETDWINGGFAILNPSVLSFIRDDTTNLEKDVYPYLAFVGKLAAYKHSGFWKCVDALRDLQDLREQYDKDGAIWLRSS